MQLYFLFIKSKGGPVDTSSVIPAVDLALEYVNNDSTILPDYNLAYTKGDSQVYVAVHAAV